MISCTTKEFWNLFEALPKGIQNQAVKAYELWNKNSHHPGLHFKTIHSTEPLYSVRISCGYREMGIKNIPFGEPSFQTNSFNPCGLMAEHVTRNPIWMLFVTPLIQT